MKWFGLLFQSIVFQTVISGVLIFILKELIQEFILLPIKKYKEIIGKVDNRLKYYTNIITNSGLNRDIISESSKIMRELSCELETAYKQIFPKKLLYLLKIIPAQNLISESARSLIFLSNAGGQEGKEGMNFDEIAKLRKNLNISEI